MVMEYPVSKECKEGGEDRLGLRAGLSGFPTGTVPLVSLHNLSLAHHGIEQQQSHTGMDSGGTVQASTTTKRERSQLTGALARRLANR